MFKIVPDDFVELPTSWFVAMRSIQLSYGRNKTSILGKPHGALSVDRAMCRRFTRGAHPNNTHRVLKAPRTADAGLWARRLIGPCTTKRRSSGYLIWRRGRQRCGVFRTVGTTVEVWRRERDSNPRWAFDPYALSRGAPSTTRPSLRSKKSRSILTEPSSSRARRGARYSVHPCTPPCRAIASACESMFKFAPGEFVDHSAISPLLKKPLGDS